MDADDLGPVARRDPLASLAMEDLDRLSQDELAARIAVLEAEIVRCRARMTAADRHRSAADALFGRR